MGGQVLADRGAPVHDAQHAGVDERGQRPAPVRHQVVVDRVGLHDDGLALHEELGQHVTGAEGGHVAGGQHQGRAGEGHGVGVRGRLLGGQGVAGDARLHPDLGRRLGKRDAVEGAVREDLDPEASVGGLPYRAGESRLAVPGDVAERVAEQAGHAHEGADAGEELLARLGGARRQALGGAGGGQPVVLGRQGVLDHSFEEVGPGGGVGLGPFRGVVSHQIDHRAERGGVGRGDGGGGVGARARAGGRRLTGRGDRPPARDRHDYLPVHRQRTEGAGAADPGAAAVGSVSPGAGPPGAGPPQPAVPGGPGRRGRGPAGRPSRRRCPRTPRAGPPPHRASRRRRGGAAPRAGG